MKRTFPFNAQCHDFGVNTQSAILYKKNLKKLVRPSINMKETRFMYQQASV